MRPHAVRMLLPICLSGTASAQWSSFLKLAMIPTSSITLPRDRQTGPFHLKFIGLDRQSFRVSPKFLREVTWSNWLTGRQTVTNPACAWER